MTYLTLGMKSVIFSVGIMQSVNTGEMDLGAILELCLHQGIIALSLQDCGEN